MWRQHASLLQSYDSIVILTPIFMHFIHKNNTVSVITFTNTSFFFFYNKPTFRTFNGPVVTADHLEAKNIFISNVHLSEFKIWYQVLEIHSNLFEST